MSGLAVLYLIITVVVDVFVDEAWAFLNATTNYALWQPATVVAYQHLLPFGVSAGLAALAIGKLS